VVWDTLRAFAKLLYDSDDHSRGAVQFTWFDIFRRVDVVGTGTVDGGGFAAVLNLMGVTGLEAPVLASVMASVNSSGSGVVDYRELLRVLQASDAEASASPVPALLFDDGQGKGSAQEGSAEVQITIPVGTNLANAAASAACRPGGGPMLAALKAAGADLNLRVRGKTPLHLASWEGLEDNIDALGGLGASVERRDRHGSTPLHFAACQGREGAVRALLKVGASLAARTTRGDTPLHVAAQHGQV
jgi:hypothetical protein